MKKLTFDDYTARAWAICVLFGIIGVLLKKPFGITTCVIVAIMWALTRIMVNAVETYKK